MTAEAAETVVRTPFREFARRFKQNRAAVAGLFVTVGICLAALAFAVLYGFGIYFPYDPDTPNVENKLAPPSRTHILGTDHLGRDVFARMAKGAGVSLTVGLVAVAVSVVVGIIVGSIAGYFGGAVDSVLMRFTDAMMCFPRFFLILTVIALVQQHPFLMVMIVIGLTSWMGTARFVRAEFLSLRERDFVHAARASGARNRRIIFSHILPNALTPVLVSATIGIASAILLESGLSFLGFGVQPPRASWGNIISDGKMYIFDAPWLTIFPGIAIFVTVLAINLLGEGLRDALDPRLKYRMTGLGRKNSGGSK